MAPYTLHPAVGNGALPGASSSTPLSNLALHTNTPMYQSRERRAGISQHCVVTRKGVPEPLMRTPGLTAFSIFAQDYSLSSGSRGRHLSAFGIIFISITMDSMKQTAVLHPNTE